MSENASEKTNLLLQSIINRLENAPIEFVEAFIDLLAAPDRKRNDALLQDLLVQVWLVLEHPVVFAQSSNLNNALGNLSRPPHTAPYDWLIQYLRAV